MNLIRIAVLVGIFTMLAACQPSAGSKSAPSSSNGNSDGPIKERFSLRPAYEVGQRVRTTRVLRSVDDSNPQATLRYEVNEVYVQEIQALRDGFPSKVERLYERSEQSVGTTGAMQSELGPLDGKSLEMTQTLNGVSVRVMDGEVSEAVLQKLLIVGFDAALLPSRPVGLGDVWTINVADNPGLGALLSAFGLEGQSNVLTAQLALVDRGEATISLDWKVTGKVGGQEALVFRLRGELIFVQETGLVREVSLNGGRRGAGGETRNQISMSISRELVKSWYE